MLFKDNSVRGIFKYSEDIYFEKGDFVVFGDCIYICKGGNNGDPIKGINPNEDADHVFYSEYPGDKIVNASEYYEYVESENRDEQLEDKYVSAHSLCEILENMYFGFGDNGIVYDHVIYNPNTGIEYCVRGVRQNLDYSTRNVLDMILQENSLGNGLIKISRTLPEISNLVFEDYENESDVVILKQYTYLDSEGLMPFRVQELLDPEKNKIYFRFAKGEALENSGYNFENSIASAWKSLYYNNEDALEKLNSLQNYYEQKIQENDEKLARISGKYCYRDVIPTETNQLGQSTVILEAGSTRDIKSRESFHTSPCLLNVLIKVQAPGSNVYRNYSVVIDAKDACDAPGNSETYLLQDDISLISTYNGNLAVPTITLTTTSGIIKNIYYRDYTLGHVHDWVIQDEDRIEPTCTEPGLYLYVCQDPLCNEERTEIQNPLGHDIETIEAVAPTCIAPGNIRYYHCHRCDKYFYDQEYTQEIQDPINDIIVPAVGGNHSWGEYQTVIPATCTNTGQERRVCSVCHTAETRSIPALGHSMYQDLGQAATCGKYGVEAHWHCGRCNKDFEDQQGLHQLSQSELRIYPSGSHNFDNSINYPIILSESTYTDEPIGAPSPTHGLGLNVCTVCNNKVEFQFPFKRHEFDQTQAIVQRQAQANGRLHYPSCEEGYCIECGSIRRNYNWNENVSIEQQLENHIVVHTEYNYTPPTCDRYGFWRGDCLLCGEHDVVEYDWNNPPVGHTIPNPIESEWEPNTCRKDAQFVGTCSVCGHQGVQVTDDQHKAIGHIDKDPINSRCDECGMSLEP